MNKEFLILILVIFALGCKKPYDPPVITSNTTYLVVEGTINPGRDSTVITLSHTVNISSKIALSAVTGASVAVVSDQNATYPLYETGNGNYVSAGLNLDNSPKYRLTIKTSEGKQY